MKRVFTSLAIMLLFSCGVFAQQWIATYNGTGNGIDAVKAMVTDNSGNVYVTGSSFNGSANSDDFITIKYNSSGARQWVARYNGPGSGSDIPFAIFVDANGYVYVTGYSDQLTGGYINNDATTVKYNPAGVQVWAARYDGDRQRADEGHAIKVDANGNVYITGSTTVRNGAYTKLDYLTIKYNSSGTQLWKATYNGPANQDDEAVGLGLDGSGNIYVTGTSFAGNDPVGEQDYLTIKYNSAGAQLWTARYNGPVSEPDRATAIAVDNAGNSFVTGYSQGSDLDFATVRYNTNGVQQWVARYDGPAHSSDIAYAIALDKNGNVYVTGSDQSIINNTDYCTIKYNPSGTQLWRAHYAGNANDNDEAQALFVDANANVYVSGYINGVSPSWDMATVKYNTNGVQQWAKKYNGTGNGNDNGVGLSVDASGNVYVSGTSAVGSSNTNFVTIKYTSNGLREETPEDEYAQAYTVDYHTLIDYTSIRVYPNPARNFFTLELPTGSTLDVNITDISGKVVLGPVTVSEQKQIDCSSLPNGYYFIAVSTDDSKVVFLEKLLVDN